MSHLVSRTQLSWFSLYPSGNLLLCPLLVLSHLPNLGAYARSSFYSLLVISPIFQAIPTFTYQLYESPKPRSGFCVTASASPADSSLTRWLPVGGSVVKNLPAMQETPIQFLGGEDPLEEEMATPSSILARKIPWTEETGKLPSVGSQRVRHDWSEWADGSCILSVAHNITHHWWLLLYATCGKSATPFSSVFKLWPLHSLSSVTILG